MPLDSRRPARIAARCLAAAVAGILLFTAVPWAGAAGPRPGRHPLDPDGRMRISEADRCPVCGMKPHRYPKFAGAIQMTDRTTYYFCSSGCMIRTWLQPERYLARPAAERLRPVTREYFTGVHVDARSVVWVSGSDVIGPMGPAVIPLAGEAHADTFRKRHGGRHTFRLDRLDPAMWEKVRR